MYVSNLGFHINDEDLRNLFEPFGQVQSAKVITNRETGDSRGFGFVEMSISDDANQAMNKLNGKEVEGRSISVSIAKPREARTDRKIW
jgi:RNA recognition motif-containing protein